MRSVVNNKIYDTAKAEEIAVWSNGYNYHDFNSCTETLYRTEKGNWFLHGEGGANSRYCTHCGNSRGPGEQIIALSDYEVKQWLVEKDNVDVLEKYFADELEEA